MNIVTTTITISATLDAKMAAEIAEAIRRHEINQRHRLLHGNSLDAILTMHRRYDVGTEHILPERAPERSTPA